MNKEKALAEKRAISLAATKLYNDCMSLRTHGVYPEIEHFFETWARRCLVKTTEAFRNGVFRVFLQMLSLSSHG